MKDKFFKFGEISSNSLITILFYTGIVPILFKSITFGKTVYLNNTIYTTVKSVYGGYTGKEINNLPLGVFQGVIVFIVSIIIWKVICEILLIIVQYFERKNKEMK